MDSYEERLKQAFGDTSIFRDGVKMTRTLIIDLLTCVDEKENSIANLADVGYVLNFLGALEENIVI